MATYRKNKDEERVDFFLKTDKEEGLRQLADKISLIKENIIGERYVYEGLKRKGKNRSEIEDLTFQEAEIKLRKSIYAMREAIMKLVALKEDIHLGLSKCIDYILKEIEEYDKL